MSIPTMIELVQKNLIIETHNFLKIEHNVLQLGEVPPCRMFNLSTKVYGGILPNCCYKLVRFNSTELDLKDETFFFSFLCGGKNKIK
jgi:hypothetical protein